MKNLNGTLKNNLTYWRKLPYKSLSHDFMILFKYVVLRLKWLYNTNTHKLLSGVGLAPTNVKTKKNLQLPYTDSHILL